LQVGPSIQASLRVLDLENGRHPAAAGWRRPPQQSSPELADGSADDTRCPGCCNWARLRERPPGRSRGSKCLGRKVREEGCVVRVCCHDVFERVAQYSVYDYLNKSLGTVFQHLNCASTRMEVVEALGKNRYVQTIPRSLGGRRTDIQKCTFLRVLHPLSGSRKCNQRRPERSKLPVRFSNPSVAQTPSGGGA
jgi:hypothetical protein